MSSDSLKALGRQERVGIFATLAHAISTGKPPQLEASAAAEFARGVSELGELGLITFGMPRTGSNPRHLPFDWSSSSFDKSLIERLVALLDTIILGIRKADFLGECPMQLCLAKLRHDTIEDDEIDALVAAGRGATLADATLGCLAEAAERQSALFRPEDQLIESTIEALGNVAIDPARLQLFSSEQYEDRASWNAWLPEPHQIPQRIGARDVIDWVCSTPGLSTRAAYLPAACCWIGYPKAVEQGSAVPDSSGCAVGSTLQDAAIRGFLELVERDAASIWWYNMIRRPAPDAVFLDDTLIKQIVAWCRERGRIVHLIDITHDLRIPVMVAISANDAGHEVGIGFGASANALAAARSALGEMIQFEANLRLAERRAGPGSFDKIFSGHDLLTWSRRTCLFDHPFLNPAQVIGERSNEVGQDLSLAACHEICKHNNLDFLALDVSRRDIGVPVARVIVPGLRGIWPRFAPGRLFDVPVKLGWVERRLSVAELNPTPILY